DAALPREGLRGGGRGAVPVRGGDEGGADAERPGPLPDVPRPSRRGHPVAGEIAGPGSEPAGGGAHSPQCSERAVRRAAATRAPPARFPAGTPPPPPPPPGGGARKIPSPRAHR